MSDNRTPSPSLNRDHKDSTVEPSHHRDSLKANSRNMSPLPTSNHQHVNAANSHTTNNNNRPSPPPASNHLTSPTTANTSNKPVDASKAAPASKMTEDQAATKIQSLFRGYKTRSDLLKNVF